MEQKNPLYRSFGFAFKGIIQVLKERNFKIQLFAAAVAIILGFFYSISSLEWLAIIICIGMVLCLEMINTALEKSIDFIQPEWDPKAGLIKDISAGAVLVAATVSATVAGIIFIPKMLLKCYGS